MSGPVGEPNIFWEFVAESFECSDPSLGGPVCLLTEYDDGSLFCGRCMTEWGAT